MMHSPLRRSLLRLIAAWSACVVLGVADSRAAEPAWDRFRGPNGSGISEATTVPAAWTDADYNWRVDLPGPGISSPVIWGERLFVTAADEEKLERYLLCYAAADGKLLWKQGVPFVAEKKHLKNTFASNTPAVDAERVYTIWQSRAASQLVAYDHAGKQLWTCELGPYRSGHGCGISPIVTDGVVAINYVQEGDSRLIGVDAATGRERWTIPRKSVKASYSTPCVFTGADGRNQLIFTSWLHGFTSVDPTTGRVLWERDAFDVEGDEKRSIGSPFTAGGLIYGNCGFVGGKKFLVAVRPGASDQSTPVASGTSAASGAAEVFRLERNVNHMPTALAHRGLLFLWTDAGIVVCARADTGKIVWQERLGGNFAGSPVCVGGKLYCLSDEGEMIVLAAAEEFAALGRVKLDSGSISTPAAADGKLYFRTEGKLYSLGGAKK